MPSTPQIISDLRVMMGANHQLELLSSFRGVPFVCKANIESVEANRVQLKALEPSMACLEYDKHPRVLGSDYFEPALAKVISFDVLTGTVVLENLSYVGAKLGERMIVRVEPNEPITVKMEGDGIHSEGQLADISFSGIGVRILYADYSSSLKPGTSFQVSMQLPNGDISMPGTVISALKTTDFYRLSIRFGPDGVHKSLIFHYLVDRRNEIEQELFGVYNTLVEEKRAASSS
ncbi:MAG: PilZ domain-containing protein [Chloroflexota bacterium]